MATLTTNSVTRAGLTDALVAAAGGGDRFTPGATTWIEVNNGGGGSITVTIPVTKVPIPNIAISSLSVAVAAGARKKIGPLPADFFTAVDGTGLGDITYSGVTSVTVGVFST